MRWEGRRRSSNVEDRRDQSGPSLGGSGGGGMLNLLPMVFQLFGVKGVLLAVLAIGAYSLFSGNLGTMIGGDQGAVSQQQAGPVAQSPAEKEMVAFTETILADTEDTWNALFRSLGGDYREPSLVLYRNATASSCGLGQAAMGPFYCPMDEKVYLDLAFFDELQTRFKAPGDFAQAYVIAHEIGHHVQTLLGISDQVQKAKRGLTQTRANQLTVRQELQADCLAGVWAYHADRSRQLLESGDVEEGLRAASAIGDDRLQKQARGYVSPDSFTHGSSAQRVRWFRVGLERGDIEACDTFAADNL